MGDFEAHLADLRAVLEKLRSAGLTAHAAKCHFAVDELHLLGHVIRDGRVFPGTDKLAAIKNLTGSNIKTKKTREKCPGFNLLF